MLGGFLIDLKLIAEAGEHHPPLGVIFDGNRQIVGIGEQRVNGSQGEGDILEKVLRRRVIVSFVRFDRDQLSDRSPFVVHLQVQDHVHDQPAGLIGQWHVGDQFGVGIVDRRADHRREPQEIDVLRALSKDGEVIAPCGREDEVTTVHRYFEIVVDVAEVLAAAEYRLDVPEEPIVISPSQCGNGDVLLVLAQVVALPHVQDNINRQPPLRHELAFGNDAGQLSFDPHFRLDLLHMSGGHHHDLVGTVENDLAVLAPGLDQRRAVDQDAGAGEIEDIAFFAFSGILATGHLDQAAGLDHGANARLVLGVDDDFRVSGFGPVIVVDRADIATGLGVALVLHLAAGNDVPFNLGVVFGIDLHRAVVVMGGYLTGAFDTHTDVGTDVGVFGSIDIGEHDIALGGNVATGIEYVSEQGVDRAGFIGGGAAYARHGSSLHIGHAQGHLVRGIGIHLEQVRIGELQVARRVDHPEVVEYGIVQLIVEQIDQFVERHARRDREGDIAPIRTVALIDPQRHNHFASRRGVSRLRGIDGIGHHLAGDVVAGAVPQKTHVNR